jgi:aldehyde dehydrogenase (NAD+)
MTAATAQSLERYRMFVGGRWCDAASGATFESLDPYSGTPWAIVPDAAVADVDRAVAAAREAFDGAWGARPAHDRGRLLGRLARLVERDSEALSAIETRDNGRLLRDSRAQVGHVVAWLDYFAGMADKLEGATIPTRRPELMAYTRREPVGAVGIIVPWNAPLLLLAWKLAPALAAGCTVVVKPSDHTPASALELARSIEEAGIPGGVVNVVTGFGPAVGRALAAHPGIDKVAFTGSTATGIDVGRAAVGNMTRFSLELGGKSPQVVFADGDLDAVAEGVAEGVFTGTGQVCMAGSRLLVEARVHDELVERVAARARGLRLGDPEDPRTEMGPVANEAQLARVLGYLEEAAAGGATAVCGGGRPDLDGLFVEPTVLTGVAHTAGVAQEEVFGPVLVAFPFGSEDEAVELANATPYGLAAGVWTRDVARAHRVAHRIRAGSVWINTYRVFDPGVPFGGYGRSGMGRENGFDVMHEYTETKAVWLNLAPQP